MKKQFQLNAIALFSAVFLSISLGYSQTDFIKGYIVTTKNDTIKGFLKEKDLRKNPKAVYKLTFTDSKTMSVKQADYLLVQMGRTTYERIIETSISEESGQPFTTTKILKLERNGFTKLYSDIHNHGGSATAAYGKYETFHLKKGNEPIVKLNRIGFKATLRKHLSDMPDITQKTENKDFDYSSIPQLINEYNIWYFNK